MAKRIVKFSLYVELEEEREIEALESSLQGAVCPFEPSTNHPETCPLPWFLTTRVLEPSEADTWRDVLNR